MKLSERLSAIAGAVTGRSLADIGTDHGRLPVWLCSAGKIDRAAACDVNPEPLARATSNIRRAGLESVIESRLGYGLSPLREGEFETCVAAGMGGLLTIDILSAAPGIAAGFKRLILQPQRDSYSVRKFLIRLKFEIVNEIIVFEGGKYYNILCCEPSASEPPPRTEAEYMFGRIPPRNARDIFRDYLLFRLGELTKIIKAAKGSPSAADALFKAEEAARLCAGVIKCL